MSSKDIDLKRVLELVQCLTPAEKLRLIELVIPDLESTLLRASKGPLRVPYGALADQGPAPSAEDVDEVRREMWRGFPRDDIA